ncbi:MAG TPA: hypothetical protein VK501_04505 [Baekduia sp.]|uniref:hypothetical protein n=1 Tax=Baekduia sp. TaxID=2600305 RepID=UPI002CFDFBE0|nr:hypothetical protein [Baekduia sp.]HMJ33159.1 hypothetical protein [Baekduia sp.]
MAKLTTFSPPAGPDDLSADARKQWSPRVSGLFQEVQDGSGPLPQFYDPTEKSTASDATSAVVPWPAFPGTLDQQGGTDEQRWQAADDREAQDEYCEWAVTRDDAGRVIRVTFTTETPDYYDHLLQADTARFEQLYAELAGRPIDLARVRGQDGNLNPLNPFNRAGDGTIVHLSQGSNTLGAAVTLAGQATVVRVDDDGHRVTNKKQLVRCGQLGGPDRNSDPQIAMAINNQAADGAEVSLADPPGLFLGDFLSAGLQTPDHADAKQFWTVTRGTAERSVRAVFEVPKERGYVVGDIVKQGHKITTGGQLAEHVRVRIVAAVLPGTVEPITKPCR